MSYYNTTEAAAKDPRKRVCPNCQAPMAILDKACTNCGRIFEDVSAPLPKPIVARPPVNLGGPGEFKNLQPLPVLDNRVKRYLAKSHNTDKTVLLKEINLEEPGALSILRSYEKLSKLNNPVIPTFFQAYRVDDKAYLCLEWKEGRPLAQLWSENGITELHRLDWIRQLAQAVSTLNELGLICVELSPGCLMVEPSSGTAFIQDFSMLEELPYQPHSRTRASLYIAPEVYTNAQDVSPRTDVYTLGAAWLELTIQQPLSPSLVRDRKLPSPAEILTTESVLPGINRLITRALSSDLELRYKTLLQFEEAIRLVEEEFSLSESLIKRFSQFNNLAGWSDVGVERDNDEDSFTIDAYKLPPDHNFTLALVADGMGGEAGGEVASQLVAETIKSVVTSHLEKVFSKTPNNPTFWANSSASSLGSNEFKSELATVMASSINSASNKVFSMARAEPKLNNMGSTLVMAVCIGDELYIANVGDSRAYLIRPSQIIQLSQDHTKLSDMRRKKVPVSKADEGRLRGVLARNLGYQSSALGFFGQYTLRAGDLILLCCDGLTDALSDQEILNTVAESESRQEKLLHMCWRLINRANTVDGQDNITITLYRHPFF